MGSEVVSFRLEVQGLGSGLGLWVLVVRVPVFGFRCKC